MFGLALLAVANRAHAQTQTESAPPNDTSASTASNPIDEATARARRHFKNGIKLYTDADYRGALAEFEAAYREKPSPSSLQNIALSLRGLFRYAEAAEALRLLLARHGTELEESERRAVQAALDELASLVGTLAISVDPPHAKVSVNGRSLTAEERARGLSLNVGEHTVVAEAPGYARKVEVVRLASQQKLPLVVKLEPTAGFLEIVTDDPRAAIAVDGEPLAYHRWSGPVDPDVDHTVQIYRGGFEPFETTVNVEVGERVRVTGALGPPTGEHIDTAPPRGDKPGAPPALKVPRGMYLLGALGIAGMNDAPLGLEVSTSDLTFGSLGARAGYRLSQILAIEAAIDFGRAAAERACQREMDGCTERNFSLSSLRFGPNLRLYTGGETLRFPIGIGAGIASHRLELAPVDGDPGLTGGRASGADPYFCLEFGASYNYRHLLIELVVNGFIESVTELRGDFDGAGRTTAFESGTLPLLGLSLKVGYSRWAPKR